MQVFDLMGYPPCHYNKINIHIGGIYEDKEHTIRRFAENFNTRLSPNLQSRLTVENDDRPNSYSMTDLLLLHNLTGIPLVSANTCGLLKINNFLPRAQIDLTPKLAVIVMKGLLLQHSPTSLFQGVLGCRI